MSRTPPTDPNAAPAAAAPARGASATRRRAIAAGAGGVALAGLGAWGAFRALAGRGPETLPKIDYAIVDGRRIGPAELHGRVVVVNFWATTCPVCVAEMPELVALYEAYRTRGLEMIAVAMPYDRPDRVLHFAQTRGLPFPVALDPMGTAVAAWGGVEGTPLTWLVAPDGRVVGRWLGRPDFVRLRRDVESMLPSRPA